MEQLQQLIAWSQSNDVLGRWREVRQRGTVARSAARVAVTRVQPRPAPASAPRILSSDIVGQPADHVEEALSGRGVVIRRERFEPRVSLSAVSDVAALFRDAQPGDEITLYEEAGTVRYFTIAKPPAAIPRAPAQPLAEAAEPGPPADLADRVTALEQELATLRAQLPKRRT